MEQGGIEHTLEALAAVFYSIHLLDWYKGTNTDACGAGGTGGRTHS